MLGKPKRKHSKPALALETRLGRYYQGDCLDYMRSLAADSVDLIFADPPFNLNKQYPSKVDDNSKEEKYEEWMRSWLAQCVRLLRPGGSLFVWNLPRWSVRAANCLRAVLTFRPWIAVDIKYSLPISGRLSPSHSALLYFCEGKK